MSVSDGLEQDDKPRLQQKTGDDAKSAETESRNIQAKSPDGRDRLGERAKGSTDSDQDADARKNDSADAKKPNFLRRHPLLIVAALALVVVAAIAGWIWYQEASKFQSTDDAFIAGRQFTVSPKVSGYIREVFVTDNQAVNASDTIIVIDDRDYRTALAQAEAQLAQAEANIPNIDAQILGQQAQIAEAEAQIKDAQASLAFAKDEDQRAQQLANNGSGTVQRAQQTRSALIQSQASIDRTTAALNAAQKQLAALRAQRVSSESNIAQAKAQRDQAQINLGYTAIRAEQGGRIVQLTAAKGQLVQAGQALMIIVPNPLWIVANFRETQIQEMRPGQPVTIRIDAYSNRTFKGHVDSIQPGSGTVFSLLPAENATGNYVKVVQRVPVKLVFDEQPDVVIGPGMSVVPSVRIKD